MKKCKKALYYLAVVSLIATTACSSSEPCERCGNTPTKGYTNQMTNEKEYYCSECSSRCDLCSKKATKNYTSALGTIVFVCDDCYRAIQEINS